MGDESAALLETAFQNFIEKVRQSLTIDFVALESATGDCEDLLYIDNEQLRHRLLEGVPDHLQG